jgi:hypothetical protein
MALGFSLQFLGVAAVAAYFLFHEAKVKSVFALRAAWVCLGLSLITSIFVGAGKSLESGLIVAAVFGNIFLGLACFFLPFVVFPRESEEESHKRRMANVKKTLHGRDAEFSDWYVPEISVPDEKE